MPKLISIDLQPITPIEGITTIQGDMTSMAKVDEILAHFTGHKADLVISDGAPDVTGLHDMDEFMQAQLILAGLTVCTHILADGGAYVAKIFRGKDIALMYSQLKLFFKEVTCAKPKASRNSSIEAFVVCQGYRPPEGFEPDDLSRVLHERRKGMLQEDAVTGDTTLGTMGWPTECIVPFVACGSVDAYDSDMSYDLPTYIDEDGVERVKPSLDPVQPPTEPFYKMAIELQRAKAQGKKKSGKQLLHEEATRR
jgi:tRNA (cytidine32/guanosine34-2'-O)-methyltransferase